MSEVYGVPRGAFMDDPEILEILDEELEEERSKTPEEEEAERWAREHGVLDDV